MSNTRSRSRSSARNRKEEEANMEVVPSPTISNVVSNILTLQSSLVGQFQQITHNMDNMKLEHEQTIRALRDEVTRNGTPSATGGATDLHTAIREISSSVLELKKESQAIVKRLEEELNTAEHRAQAQIKDLQEHHKQEIDELKELISVLINGSVCQCTCSKIDVRKQLLSKQNFVFNQQAVQNEDPDKIASSGDAQFRRFAKPILANISALAEQTKHYAKNLVKQQVMREAQQLQKIQRLEAMKKGILQPNTFCKGKGTFQPPQNTMTSVPAVTFSSSVTVCGGAGSQPPAVTTTSDLPMKSSLAKSKKQKTLERIVFEGQCQLSHLNYETNKHELLGEGNIIIVYSHGYHVIMTILEPSAVPGGKPIKKIGAKFTLTQDIEITDDDGVYNWLCNDVSKDKSGTDEVFMAKFPNEAQGKQFMQMFKFYQKSNTEDDELYNIAGETGTITTIKLNPDGSTPPEGKKDHSCEEIPMETEWSTETGETWKCNVCYWDNENPEENHCSYCGTNRHGLGSHMTFAPATQSEAQPNILPAVQMLPVSSQTQAPSSSKFAAFNMYPNTGIGMAQVKKVDSSSSDEDAAVGYSNSSEESAGEEDSNDPTDSSEPQKKIMKKSA